MIATIINTLDDEQRVVFGTLLEEILHGEIHDETRKTLRQIVTDPRDLPTPLSYMAAYCEGSRQSGRDLARSLQVELADILENIKP